jgi:hypothetical protein
MVYLVCGTGRAMAHRADDYAHCGRRRLSDGPRGGMPVSPYDETGCIAAGHRQRGAPRAPTQARFGSHERRIVPRPFHSLVWKIRRANSRIVRHAI